MDTFSFIPYGTRKPETNANNVRVEFGTGNEQIQQKTINPIKKWELTFRGELDDFIEIEEFFDSHCNGQKFYWVEKLRDDISTTHVCTFANDSFAPSQFIGYNESGYGVGGFEVTLTLRKVWGVV